MAFCVSFTQQFILRSCLALLRDSSKSISFPVYASGNSFSITASNCAAIV